MFLLVVPCLMTAKIFWVYVSVFVIEASLFSFTPYATFP